jgi:ABC-type transport system substrate-binding protein
VRRRDGRALRVDILVPSTSSARRRLAEMIQEMWRGAGVEATVTTVDFAVFQERLAGKRFDSYIGAWLDEPTPRALADQWTRAGWDALNHGRYASAAFDSLLTRASRERDERAAGEMYREAIAILNADVPAVFLYAPSNSAVVAKRVENFSVDPFSWARTLREWQVGAP